MHWCDDSQSDTQFLQLLRGIRLKERKIRPLLEQIRDQIIKEQFNALTKSPIAKAMACFNNQFATKIPNFC